MRIKIKSGIIEAIAELENTETAKTIYDELPIESIANTWGNEIYFEIPVSLDVGENARITVEKGDVAYWSTGQVFLYFFWKNSCIYK